METLPGITDINLLRHLADKGQVINPIKTAHPFKSQVIDGFVKAPQSPAPLKTRTTRTVSATARGLHQRGEKAQTLMRDALKTPATGFSSRIQQLKPGFSPQRELRARQTIKNSKVERFGGFGETKASPKINRAPAIQGELVKRPTAQASPPASSSAVALPSMVTSASHHRLERMLDAALTGADAHKQAMKYQAARHFWQRPGFLGRHRGIKLGVLVLIILGVGLFAAWQKFPQLSVKLASIKAHISASVPAYKPEGYSLASPATTQAGAVVIKYNAPNQSQGFDLTQKSSDITSSGVAQSVVPSGAAIQTSHVNGNTVYIYGNNNDAAWVNNGILYTIKDHSKLTSDQILNIVKSLN